VPSPRSATRPSNPRCPVQFRKGTRAGHRRIEDEEAGLARRRAASGSVPRGRQTAPGRFKEFRIVKPIGACFPDGFADECLHAFDPVSPTGRCSAAPANRFECMEAVGVGGVVGQATISRRAPALHVGRRPAPGPGTEEPAERDFSWRAVS